MATYVPALPALTTSLFRAKFASLSMNASAFYDRDVRVKTTPRPDFCRPASLVCDPEVPAWLITTVQSLLDLLHLPRNWDGYGAVQLQEQIVQKALMVLVEVMENDAPTPSVVPLSDGGIQVEWHRRGRNLEIEFPAGETPSFYYYEDGSELESEGQVSRSYDRIQAYIVNMK
jgi:hypothetical protein